ncbi:hypothetical protein HI855_00205 [Cyanobacteria bacterium 150NLHA]|uniref:hypothetical protein n=1 Tax=unclassified Prochlorococcus TaxID=2627481 RepID=UPI0007BC72B9|nr:MULTISPECIES: hypothetical protein [unclassified Prochlorococcus]KZR68147.1 hypothetical protein PMIT1312_00251 [Prochlorococcus marinus str. MIT 1312]NMO84290.1 hypothetical protein [Prochlorococcus sp. P1344]NMP05025.1 hypothetical protein [Prochlorococcus sp. P1361]
MFLQDYLEEYFGKPVGILDGFQWMRVPEWSFGSLSAIAIEESGFIPFEPLL